MLEFRLPPQATADASRGFISHMGVADRLLDAIRTQLDQLKDSLPTKDEVIDAAGAAYDRYVAPLDIPYVPNLFEPRVDALLKGIFLSMVDRVYDALVSGS